MQKALFKVVLFELGFSAVGAVAVGDQLFVCGGFDGISSLDTVEKFDPMTNSWTLVASMTKNRSAAGNYVFTLPALLISCYFCTRSTCSPPASLIHLVLFASSIYYKPSV